MHEVSKTGVLIDLCPNCKGIFLDRGELDKVIGRAREVEREWEQEQSYARSRPQYDDREPDRWRNYGGGKPYRKKKWSDIFDIFD
jgi:Zn-finger nucleic acid-binding protein